MKTADPPVELAAIGEAVIALLLLLVPGQAVVAATSRLADPPPPLHCGAYGLLAGASCVCAFGWIRRADLPLALRTIWSLRTYALFLVGWLPFAFLLYPYVMHRLGHRLPPQAMLEYLAGTPDWGFAWLALLLACLIGPIAEELVFRGFLFRAVAPLSGPAAIAFTSVLFGLLHEVSVIVPVTLLGGLFGFVRWRTGGIGSSILLHIVHNVWTVILVLGQPRLLELCFDTK
ncbi:MAG: CPBP family intramembrane metalloprotease [Planctomycetes bacterium]|nr:CPBP family intramembrane metalloprotease [Planctomycetota bacterium]